MSSNIEHVTPTHTLLRTYDAFHFRERFVGALSVTYPDLGELVVRRSFADAKNFAAPSILENKPGKTVSMPQQVWEEVRHCPHIIVLRKRLDAPIALRDTP